MSMFTVEEFKKSLVKLLTILLKTRHFITQNTQL